MFLAPLYQGRVPVGGGKGSKISSALHTVLSESEKFGHFSTLDTKYVSLQSHIPQKATKVKIQFV